MESIKNSYNLYLEIINETIGFGVFTNSKLNIGDVVETCYCLPFHPKDTQYSNFLYTTNSNEDFLSLGFGSIYNHSETPNIKWNIVSVKYRIINFIAIRDIEIGEELTHNYGKKWWNKRNELKLV